MICIIHRENILFQRFENGVFFWYPYEDSHSSRFYLLLPIHSIYPIPIFCDFFILHEYKQETHLLKLPTIHISLMETTNFVRGVNYRRLSEKYISLPLLLFLTPLVFLFLSIIISKSPNERPELIQM